MKKFFLSITSIFLISIITTYANGETKAKTDIEAKKRQILRNIANESRKPSADVRKRQMLRMIASEARKPQYIKFLDIYNQLVL